MVIGAVLIFTLYNYPTKTTVVLFGRVYENVSIVLLTLYAFLAGVAAVVIFAIAERISLAQKIGKLKKNNENLKKELDALRNLPLGEEE